LTFFDKVIANFEHKCIPQLVTAKKLYAVAYTFTFRQLLLDQEFEGRRHYYWKRARYL